VPSRGAPASRQGDAARNDGAGSQSVGGYTRAAAAAIVLSKAALAALLDGSRRPPRPAGADVSRHYGDSFALGRGKAVTLRLAADAENTDAYNVVGIAGADSR
jgi:hypothetical protein